MRNTISKHFLQFTQVRDEDARRRASVLRVLAAATLIVLCLAFLSVALSFTAHSGEMPENRLIAVGAATAFAAALYFLMRKKKYVVVAYGLLAIYMSLATVMAVHWSVDLPAVSLLYSIVIVLAGMVLGAGYALSAALLSALVLLGVQLAVVHGTLHPNVSWRLETTPHLIDIALYFLVFIVLGVSSWLFNRQTDYSLHRALRAEIALQREKEKLEMQVEARTQELQAAQLEKMEQLYRFAELGQFSTSLLHDLGNHMSTLTLDVEGMAEQHQRSELQTRIKRRIGYIDNIVRWAYENINGKVQPRNFNVKHETNEVVKILQYNARQANVQLRVTIAADTTLRLYGDPNRFQQLLANLVTNAIDAYNEKPEAAKREVHVELAENEKGDAVVTVRDFGAAIPTAMQTKIFEPFYSTKHDGMGIGLFIVKQIAEDYFRGSVAASSNEDETYFTVVLNGAVREK